MAAVTAAAILAFGGLLHRDPPAASAGDVLPTAVAAELQKGFAAGDTEAEIAGLQAELRANRRNFGSSSRIRLCSRSPGPLMSYRINAPKQVVLPCRGKDLFGGRPRNAPGRSFESMLASLKKDVAP